MEVKDDRLKCKRVEIDKLYLGDCFMYDNKVYLKIDNKDVILKDECGNKLYCCSCGVNVESGYIESFNDTLLVEKINACVVINPLEMK